MPLNHLIRIDNPILKGIVDVGEDIGEVATLYPANGTKARLPYGSRYRMTKLRHAHVVADCRDSGSCTFADNYEKYSALNRSAASFRLIRFV